jgi:hypothetical protein
MKTNKINFKQPKYYMPPAFYLISLFLGYIAIDTFNIELGEAGNGHLKTTDYLSSALPDAKTDSLLGSKMDNTERKYGKITDLSGLASVESAGPDPGQIRAGLPAGQPGRSAPDSPQ